MENKDKFPETIRKRLNAPRVCCGDEGREFHFNKCFAGLLSQGRLEEAYGEQLPF